MWQIVLVTQETDIVDRPSGAARTIKASGVTNIGITTLKSKATTKGAMTVRIGFADKPVIYTRSIATVIRSTVK